jgi:hypothetical protein
MTTHIVIVVVVVVVIILIVVVVEARGGTKLTDIQMYVNNTSTINESRVDSAHTRPNGPCASQGYINPFVSTTQAGFAPLI